ncbi:MAG: hypothetical protein AAF108_07995 [Planctomycetota bacterium]
MAPTPSASPDDPAVPAAAASSPVENTAPPPVRSTAPPPFEPHSFEATITLPITRDKVWAWLNTPETFTKGQVFPFRVEFVPGTGVHGGSGFETGVQNIHHGPFLAVAGEIGEINPGPDGRGHYRDLSYYYGSYAISLRLIRPTRLRFWLADNAQDPANTDMTVRVDSHVRPIVRGLWASANGVFWNRFFKWTAAAAKNATPLPATDPATPTTPTPAVQQTP